MKQMVPSEGSTSNGEALSVRDRTQKKSNNSYRGKAQTAIMAIQSQETRMRNSVGIARKTIMPYLSVLN